MVNPTDENPEAVFRFSRSPHILCARDCGKVFNAVNPGLAVYYHIIQFDGVSLDEMMERTRREYTGPVVFGEDLMQIDAGEKVRILNR